MEIAVGEKVETGKDIEYGINRVKMKTKNLSRLKTVIGG